MAYHYPYLEGNAAHIPLETTSTMYASEEMIGAFLVNMTNNDNNNYYYNSSTSGSLSHYNSSSSLDPGDKLDGRLQLLEEALGREQCTFEHDNETHVRHDCLRMDDPFEMLKPQKANPSFVPIVVTHVLTFLVGVTGNSIIVATMAKDKGARNVTRSVLLSFHPLKGVLGSWQFEGLWISPNPARKHIPHSKH